MIYLGFSTREQLDNMSDEEWAYNYKMMEFIRTKEAEQNKK